MPVRSKSGFQERHYELNIDLNTLIIEDSKIKVEHIGSLGSVSSQSSLSETS
jgi:hypothetical protein